MCVCVGEFESKAKMLTAIMTPVFKSDTFIFPRATLNWSKCYILPAPSALTILNSLVRSYYNNKLCKQTALPPVRFVLVCVSVGLSLSNLLIFSSVLSLPPRAPGPLPPDPCTCPGPCPGPSVSSSLSCFSPDRPDAAMPPPSPRVGLWPPARDKHGKQTRLVIFCDAARKVEEASPTKRLPTKRHCSTHQCDSLPRPHTQSGYSFYLFPH